MKSVVAMQRLALQWRRKGVPVGFVPTMGYLHAGHASLIRDARKRVGKRGIVVVSIYVNPTQFGPTEDLSRYPRDFKRDRRVCAEAGADTIFFPTDEQMYPGRSEGLYSTYVIGDQLGGTMEGASRPAHFRGVTTIVAKLFNIVLPDTAVFGAKDFQQAAIIQRMIRDLNFPVRVVVSPTVRERDGLAMSSRNKYLDVTQRSQATVLWRALQAARKKVSGGRSADAEKLRAELRCMIEEQPAARVDYIEFFDAQTFKPLSRVRSGGHMALAVFVGNTRLIDNGKL